MRDVFYTILVVWILYRILKSVSSLKEKQKTQSQSWSNQKEGETTMNYSTKKKSPADSEGEYVDFEEIK